MQPRMFKKLERCHRITIRVIEKRVEETRAKLRRKRAKPWVFRGVNLYKSNLSVISGSGIKAALILPLD